MSEFKFITYKEDSFTATITINRPDVYNSLNTDTKFEILRSIRQANKSSQVRSIILTAEGKAFCTGQDLNDRKVKGSSKKIDLGKTLETEWNPLINAIRNSSKIIIGSINGVTAGAGLSIALACDLIVASSNTKFISGFSKLGLAPDAGISHCLVHKLGHQRTLDFFLFNNPLSAKELQQYGVINKVSDNHYQDAYEISQKINQLSLKSTKLIKENLLYAIDSKQEECLERDIYTQRYLGKSEEYQEGLNAFFEKRPPNFYNH